MVVVTVDTGLTPDSELLAVTAGQRLLLEHTGPWTVEDWWSLPAMTYGRRYEVVQGTLVISSTPDLDHAWAVHTLRRILERAAPTLMAVEVVGFTTEDSALVPDLQLVSQTLVRNSSARSLTGDDVALVVEVQSRSSRGYDRLVKAEVYAEAGVPRYWRVDPNGPTVHAGVLRNGAYVEEAEADPDGVLRVELEHGGERWRVELHLADLVRIG